MADVVTGEAVVLDVQAARLPSRILALGIDLAIQLPVLYVLTFLVAGAAFVADRAFLIGALLVVQAGIVLGYPVVCESLWRGRTVGKLALGLRVVSEDGGPERFRQALLRGLAGIVEIWVSFGAVGVIASLLSHQGRRLGDVFAGTLVVRERIPVRGGVVAAMPPELAAWARTLELSRLPDDVAMTARQYVARYAELSPEVREEMGRRIATTVSVHVSPPAPRGTPPLAYLSAVLAERRGREEWRLHAQRPGGVSPQVTGRPFRSAGEPAPPAGQPSHPPAPGPYGPAHRPPPSRPPGGFVPPS